GNQTIAGGGAVHEDDVPRLFAAQVVAVGAHFAAYGGIADFGADQPQSGLLQGLVQAEIAHHRGDDGVGGQLPLAGQGARHDLHHIVAVEHLALAVHQDGAVGVAVQRHAEIGSFSQYRLAHAGGVQRAAVAIDVLAVGIDAQRNHVGAQFVQYVGTDLVGGAVGTVDHHLDAVEGALALQTRLEEHQVAPDCVVDPHRLANLTGSGGGVELAFVEDQLLDAPLDLVVELEAFVGEEFNAVVLVRIVRRRDHHAGG